MSGSMLLWPVLSGWTDLGALTASSAVALMNREKALVIDVSDAAQFATGHIRGSKNVLLAQLKDKLPGVAKNKAVPLIFVCPTGASATRALVLAKNMGYQQAQVLGGGIQAWKAANLPLEK